MVLFNLDQMQPATTFCSYKHMWVIVIALILKSQVSTDTLLVVSLVLNKDQQFLSQPQDLKFRDSVSVIQLATW